MIDTLTRARASDDARAFAAALSTETQFVLIVLASLQGERFPDREQAPEQAVRWWWRTRKPVFELDAGGDSAHLVLPATDGLPAARHQVNSAKDGADHAWVAQFDGALWPEIEPVLQRTAEQLVKRLNLAVEKNDQRIFREVFPPEITDSCADPIMAAYYTGQGPAGVGKLLTAYRKLRLSVSMDQSGTEFRSLIVGLTLRGSPYKHSRVILVVNRGPAYFAPYITCDPLAGW